MGSERVPRPERGADNVAGGKRPRRASITTNHIHDPERVVRSRPNMTFVVVHPMPPKKQNGVHRVGGTLSGSDRLLVSGCPLCGPERSVAEALERKRPSRGAPWALPTAKLLAPFQGAAHSTVSRHVLVTSQPQPPNLSGQAPTQFALPTCGRPALKIKNPATVLLLRGRHRGSWIEDQGDHQKSIRAPNWKERPPVPVLFGWTVDGAWPKSGLAILPPCWAP
jgi:hypothetical protein